jgi:hypothetical protein
MIGVAVRDNDDIGGELGWVGVAAVPLEWAEPGSQERVGQDADAPDVDEGRGVPDEPDVDP